MIWPPLCFEKCPQQIMLTSTRLIVMKSGHNRYPCPYDNRNDLCHTHCICAMCTCILYWMQDTKRATAHNASLTCCVCDAYSMFIKHVPMSIDNMHNDHMQHIRRMECVQYHPTYTIGVLYLWCRDTSNILCTTLHTDTLCRLVYKYIM